MLSLMSGPPPEMLRGMKRRAVTVVTMVRVAQTARWIAAPPGSTKVSSARSPAQAAGHSSQPVPVETSATKKAAAIASQIQNGWVA